MSTAVRDACRGAQAPGRRVLAAGGGLAVFLALVHTVSDVLHNMLSTLLPTIQARFGLSETALALLVATLWLSSSITQPVFGALAGWINRRGVAAAGVVANSVLLSLVGVAPTVFLLFAVLFLGGLGSAALHPVGANVARGIGGERSALAVGLFSAGGELGFAVGPVVILLIVSTLGIGATPLLMIPGLALGVLTYRLVPEEEPTPAEQRPRLFDAGLLAGPIGGLAVAGVLSAVAFLTFVSATPLWLVSEGIARDSALIGWTLAAFALGAAFGAFSAGAVSTRIPAPRVTVATMAASTVPLVAMLGLEPSGASFLLIVALAGALNFASVPLLVVSAQDLAPHARASASGMLMGFTTGVAGVLYVGMGAIQESIGLEPAMTAGYLLMLPAAVVAHVVMRRN